MIVYKLIAFRRVKLNLTEFISKVRGALLKGNLKGAMGVCEENRGPVASIVKSGLLKYGKPRDEIEKTGSAATAESAEHAVARMLHMTGMFWKLQHEMLFNMWRYAEEINALNDFAVAYSDLNEMAQRHGDRFGSMLRTVGRFPTGSNGATLSR